VIHHWDYLIVTASNAVQAAAYEYQLRARWKAGRLAGFRHFLVVPDLEGKRIGSGGSTLLCLLEVLARESPPGADWPAIEAVLRKLRVLILHAGGDSRRLPAYGPCGKIFVPVPGADGSNAPPAATVFDHLIRNFAPLPAPPPDCGQVVVAAGDALIQFDPSVVNLVPGSLTALGCYATAEESSKHGVFCGPGSQAAGSGSLPHAMPVRLFLQKPSPTRQAEAGALNAEGRSILDVAVMSFGAEVAVALLKAVEVAPDERGRLAWSKAMNETIMARGLDLYREICCALGSEATAEHLLASARSSGSTWDEASLRRLFDALHPVPFHVQVLPRCRFLHFGTTRQLISSGLELIRQCGGTPPADGLLGLNNTILPGGSISGGNSWVEACQLAAPLFLAGQNVVIGVDVEEPLSLPSGACLDVVPGHDRQGKPVWFVRCYSIQDTFKDAIPAGGTLCGRPLAEWIAAAGAKPEDVWDQDIPEAKRSLWDARVFPGVAEPGDYRHWLWMFGPARPTEAQRQAFLAADRYNVAEMAWLADQEAFARRRAL
jgi:fucokinase